MKYVNIELYKYSQCTFTALYSPIAESVTPDRPALLPLDSSIQHKTTVLEKREESSVLIGVSSYSHLTLEAGDMEILP